MVLISDSEACWQEKIPLRWIEFRPTCDTASWRGESKRKNVEGDLPSDDLERGLDLVKKHCTRLHNQSYGPHSSASRTAMRLRRRLVRTMYIMCVIKCSRCSWFYRFLPVCCSQETLDPTCVRRNEVDYDRVALTEAVHYSA